MQWTQEQRQAIERRNTNILLSAAAGSGKTTVLVERVLDQVRSGETQVDRMLIVTFTRAASSDMRAKLSQALGRGAAEGDENCRRQLLLLDRASISTLHAFCSDFLRAHFESAGVDPAFRVLDDAELRRMADEALDQAIEEAYQAGGDCLKELDYGRGPGGVRAMAEILLWTLDSRPDPQGWLEQVCRPGEEGRSAWISELCGAARREIRRALLLTRLALTHPECNTNYAPALERDVEALERMGKLMTFDELHRALADFHQAAPGRKRDAGPANEEVKKFRSDAKAALEKIPLRQMELNMALKDVDLLLPQLELLGRITLRARRLLEEKKDELAGLSYSDLEHRTLRALEDPAVAGELRQRYDQVFVDEYQDTSDVQEALIGCITRGNNLFMVGDVKQSIYRFRQAEPRLFLGKYAAYGQGNGGVLLPLTMNFRSRPGILNFVNHVFEWAMQGGESEIVYDHLARLNPGNPQLEGGCVELHLLQAPDADSDGDLSEMNTCEREALFIAGCIRRMMEENPKLRYQDFAILTRARRGVLGRMAAVLMQQGIPAFADGSEAYFDSVEILLALSLLRLIANRRSDVELIGVLRSPVVGMSAEDLARIRIAEPLLPFVDAAEIFSTGDDEIARRLKEFLGQLEQWRLLAMCTDLGVLVRRILEESGLYDCVGALPGGAQRQANLNRLVDNAAQFDMNISGSLIRFLKHTEKLRERGDGEDAHLLGENEDVVRLMTVHKSKGLEFPVVFGAMMGRRYRARSGGDPLCVHRDLGLGCLYCDSALQTRRKTLPQLAIAERVRREDRAEELRVLYVLLTRARDHLVLVGSVRQIQAAEARWGALRQTPEAAGSYLDVICPSLEGAGEELCTVMTHNAEELLDMSPQALPLLKEEAPIQARQEYLQRALVWNYGESSETWKPLKLTVTSLLRQIQAPDALEPLMERPAFLSEKASQMTGTERGTAYHRAMQMLRLEALRGILGRALNEEIARQLDAFEQQRRLSDVQRQVLRPSALARFFESSVGQRLLESEEVHREWSFNAMMRISEALTTEEAGMFDEEEIMVQGTLDCCFLEKERWILLDYKSDRSTDSQALTLKYRNQLRLYALALKRITGIAVGEIYLCLLSAGENLCIPLHEVSHN